MKEKEIFNFGDKELNLNSLINNITANQQSYLDYYSSSIPDSVAFNEKVDYIKQGLKNGSITTNGTGIYYDTNGKLSESDKLMSNALHYVDTIATAQSKKERSLTKTEIAKQEEAKKLKKAELERQKAEQIQKQNNVKPDFNPTEGWSVAAAFAHSFNQNGQIPYNLLQQLVTTDKEGKEVYTDLYQQLDKNFDSISNQLSKFNGTESYINNINLFKNALKDGDLSPQDKFLGMELGFQSSELDKLNDLIKYKIKSDETVPPVLNEEVITTSESEVSPLTQGILERDDVYQKRVERSKQDINNAHKILSMVKFDSFESPKSIESDSEEEFKNYLVNYINRQLQFSNNKNFTVRQNSITGFKSPIVTQVFSKEHLQYMDPKLYNELGLKFFSKYSKTKMYKHFKDLVNKQNKEKAMKQPDPDIKDTKQDYFNKVSIKPEYQEGGIIKAQNEIKTPWRLNFDGSVHQMDNIYKLFTDNVQSYDAKQMADALNKLNGDDYKSLNFGGADNTLGFKNWNQTFNESGLNNLFGYNETKADYLGVTTKSRNNFVDYLKGKGSINTGNGDLSWNSQSNQWEYSNWTDKTDPSVESSESMPELETVEGTKGNVKAPEVNDLTLKEMNLQKPKDLNKNGILNSISGYIVNKIANKKKREIQESIPLYQKIDTPEKAFKTAYTYDLEKSKNEIMAEANSIQPITSDASVYYAAKNDAIKNARAYTTKLDTEINDRIHQTKDINSDIAFENAVRRTENINTNAKYRHDWEIEQKQGEVDFIEANNQSFQNLNKEFKHNIVTEARQKQQKRDNYAYKHLLTGLKTSPSNYINGWTKHHDLIWYKGQNGLLETNEEQLEYQQLISIVNQASSNMLAQYENINYPGMGTLHIHSSLKEDYDPSKHGAFIKASKGAKINKYKIGNFINKLK